MFVKPSTNDTEAFVGVPFDDRADFLFQPVIAL